MSDLADLPKLKRGVAGWVGRPVWREIRSFDERRKLRASPLWRGDGVPVGNDRPVLLIPGFMSGEHKAAPLAHVLSAAGWDVEIAEVGRNAGPAYVGVDAAELGLRRLSERSGEPVTVVGHTRGGQYGRVLAVRHPELVKRVIAVGSPLRTKYPPFFVVKVPAETLDWCWRAGWFGPVSIGREQEVDDHRYLEFPESVDLVSIYSRSDGIVDWRYSFDPAASMVEVSATHLGLMHSVAGVSAVVAQLRDRVERD